MWFKGPGGFGRIVNLVMSIILGLALSVYVLWYLQNLPGNEGAPIFTGSGYAVSCVACLGIGYFIGDMFPCLIWGNKLATKLGIKNKFGRHLIACLVLTLVFVTCVSLLMVWVNTFQMGGWPAFFALWSHVYVPLLVMSYIVIAIFLPLAKAIGKAIAGFSIDEKKVSSPYTFDPHTYEAAPDIIRERDVGITIYADIFRPKDCKEKAPAIIAWNSYSKRPNEFCPDELKGFTLGVTPGHCV